MATRKKLKSVPADDNTAEIPKRLRHCTSSNLGDECVDKVEDSSQSTKTPRGRTQMDRLSIQRAQGIRQEVEFDSKGRPIGKVAVELQSYVGVLAREKVKITYDSWKKVPLDVKEKIWEGVNLAFVVLPSWKIGCLKSANEKWKQFKAKLTKDFIMKRCHDSELLNTPPSEYDIPQADWSQFVISRMTEDFKKQSKLQSERSQKNKYHYRLSRKGYAQVEHEMGDELSGDVEIKRAELWKKGHASKSGEYDGDDLKATVGKIDEYIKFKNEGTLKITGLKEDVLTLALASKEHPGRVRAVGSHVTPTVYFNVPKGKAVRNDILLAQQQELMEAKAKNSELARRVEKLEATVFKTSASEVQTDEKGSCSAKEDTFVKFAKIQRARNLSNEENSDGDDVILVDTVDALQGKPVALMLEQGHDVVAYGTLVSTNVENQLLHGVPMSTNCVRVAIDYAVKESAQLPIPITGECLCIADAVGTHVAWSVHLIRMQAKKAQKNIGRQKKEPTLQHSSMPRSLYMLYCYCKVALQGGRSLALNLAYEVFGSDSMINVYIDDITPFCQLKPISANCIVVYICHLFRRIKIENKVGRFQFVNPHSIGQMPGNGQHKKCLNDQMENKSRLLANRLRGTSIGQLVLVPFNVGFHWILTVIDPNNGNVYLLDPISHRSRYEEWKIVVNLALKLFNVE